MKKKLTISVFTWLLLTILLFPLTSLASEAVRIPSCVITENDSITITAETTADTLSDDGQYYLFELQPYEDVIGDRTNYLAATGKEGAISFKVALNGKYDNTRLYSKFVVAILSGGKYMPVSAPAYITNPEATASYTADFPDPLTKKGLLIQPDMVNDAFDLGVKHVIMNIPFHHILGGSLTHDYNGKTYTFNASLINTYDEMVRLLSNKGIVITAVILNGWNPETPQLIHPNATFSETANYYNFNTATKEGFEDTKAIISFLSERYSGSNPKYGRISNWIIGNEINNNAHWNYSGEMDVEQYVKEFERVFRVFYTAIKSESKNSRVYFSTDYTWNTTNTKVMYGAKDIVDNFNAIITKGGQIDWGLAYHPYPNPLWEPEFWDDEATGEITKDFNSPVINFNNLNVLTDYFQQDFMRNASGEVRHIILSEQGFSSKSRSRGDVENQQAAAFAYAYYLVDSNPYIDSFILSRQVDAVSEVNESLAFGLWNCDMNAPNEIKATTKKKIWDVFKYIDTRYSTDYTKFAKEIIGIQNWKDVVPGFSRKE